LRVRTALLPPLAALGLTAIFAVPASARSGPVLAMISPESMAPPSTAPQSSQETPSSSQPPQPLPALGSIASYQGLTVQSIDFPDRPESDRRHLRQLIPQKSGGPLDRDRIRESIQALHATGRFADVRVEAERTASGQVSVAFVTSPNYFIGGVNVEGALKRPTANQVINATKFQLGELFTPEKLERALKNMKQLMEENGYYRSVISEEELEHPETQQVDILFRIAPGPQAHVEQVSVTGNPGYSQGQIQDIAHLEPGDFVSAPRVTSALERLRKKYQKQMRLLAQVTISGHSYRSEVNAVDYTLDIEPGPRVEIVAEGFKISRGVVKRNVPVYEENALDDDLLNEGRRNLLNYLQGRGYFDAKVGLKKNSDPAGNELRVSYIIDADPRHKLVKVEITGNKYFPPEDLRSRMQVQPAGRLLSHGRYNQGLLHDDMHGLEDLYRASGFQQVKITGNVQDDYQGQENQLAVTLHVDEGPQTLVGALHLVGNASFSEDELRRNINTAENQPFSEFNIAQDRDTVLSYYFNRGFPNATFEASAKPIPGQPNRMDVTFTIHEGEQFFVDRVLVSGLNYTRPFVVQRELQVKSGDPLSQIDMLKSQQSLYGLGIFSQVDTGVQNPEGDEQEKNVLVQAQETKRYTFNYGLGLEFQTGQPAIGTNQPLGQTGVSPRVSFGVTRLNFRGRNHTITFKSNVGRLQQRGLISYDAPRWFNSPDWRLTFSTFYDNTLDVATFSSQRLEGLVQAEQTISKTLSGTPITVMDYRFAFRRVKASNIAISPNLIPLLSQPTRVGGPGFTYIRNRRDNDLETTRGNYTTVDGSIADSHFGSEADFSRVLAQYSTYHSFGKRRPAGRKFVFARSTRIGVETAFGNTLILSPGQSCPQPALPCPGISLIPLPERFLSGGGNSHRGFGLNQAGPRDPVTGFPLGGSALFLNNLELRLPPPTLPFVRDNLSFAIFHDAGNVFTNGHNMLHNLLRWQQKNPRFCTQQSTASECDYSYISHAIGVGVRYKTPIGPVRFDFGYNLNPPAFPSCQSNPSSPAQMPSASCPTGSPFFVPQHASHFNVYFSIGQTF
jgi:outer membrane protein insertion porin family